VPWDRIFPASFNSFTQGYTKRARPSPADGDNLIGKLLTDVKNRAGAEGARWKGGLHLRIAYKSYRLHTSHHNRHTGRGSHKKFLYSWNLCSFKWTQTVPEFLVMSKSHNQCLDEDRNCNGNPTVPRPLSVNNSLELRRPPISWSCQILSSNFFFSVLYLLLILSKPKPLIRYIAPGRIYTFLRDTCQHAVRDQWSWLRTSWQQSCETRDDGPSHEQKRFIGYGSWPVLHVLVVWFIAIQKFLWSKLLGYAT
jgi:hypothetical protein